MNTEALNTLKKIREAINTIQSDMNSDEYNKQEKKLLGDVLMNLYQQEDAILNYILQEMVDKINSSNAALKLLIEQMEKSKDKLAKFSNLVKNISKVVATLAEITTKAMTAGIL